MLIDMPIGTFPMALGVIYDDPAPDLRERGARAERRRPPRASPPTSRRSSRKGQTWQVEQGTARDLTSRWRRAASRRIYGWRCCSGANI